MWKHTPVLLKEIMALANLKSGETALDATVGGGGTALAILKATAPDGKLVAFDTDPESLKIAQINLKPYKGRVVFVNDNFIHLQKNIMSKKLSIKFIVADLGPALWHLTESKYGGSFSTEGILDMRRGEEGLSAGEIIRTFSADKLAKLFTFYGEERLAQDIATKIYFERKRVKSLSTSWLANLASEVYKKKHQRSAIHPATKIFQALRIYVNKELENLASFMPLALETLAVSGRLAIVTFHSLEDRIVKNYFRSLAHERMVKILTKHAFQTSHLEQRQNPASRSAKLRVVEKIISEQNWPAVTLPSLI